MLPIDKPIQPLPTSSLSHPYSSVGRDCSSFFAVGGSAASVNSCADNGAVAGWADFRPPVVGQTLSTAAKSAAPSVIGRIIYTMPAPVGCL